MGGFNTNAIVQSAFGAPEVLQPQAVHVGDPGPQEVRLRHRAIGVNFHDIYVRTGLYRSLVLPGIPGIEGVGEIVAVGRDVARWSAGQRVAYVDRGYGAYAEERLIAQDLLVAPPSGMSDALVASSLVRGLTAAMLMEQVRRVGPGDRVLVHAMAGATGRLLVLWARHLGATVVGTVGRRAAPPEVESSCERVYSYADSEWADRALADYGATIDYVCDLIGAPTFPGGMQLAAPCGQIALFGQSGGKVDQVAIGDLAAKSLSVSRPVVFDFIADARRRAEMADSFFRMVESGVLTLQEPVTMGLDQAARAQDLLESRQAAAPIVLVP